MALLWEFLVYKDGCVMGVMTVHKETWRWVRGYSVL
jgi:hypothetical protein